MTFEIQSYLSVEVVRNKYHLLQVSQHSERMFAYRHISYFMTVVLQLSLVSMHDLFGGKSRFLSDFASSHLKGGLGLNSSFNLRGLTIQDCRTPMLVVSVINNVFYKILGVFCIPGRMMLNTRKIGW